MPPLEDNSLFFKNNLNYRLHQRLRAEPVNLASNKNPLHKAHIQNLWFIADSVFMKEVN